MPPSSRRVTLRDIAKVAGVHFTTVSLALRNHPRLPLSTREHLQALAREMGYVPDPMLSSLAVYRNRLGPVHFQATLAWVTAYPEREQWSQADIFREQHAGAARRAEELGYRLEHFWLAEPGMTAARATQILRARNITGLLIAPLPVAGGSLGLEWEHFSAVSLGYTLATPSLHLVSAHQYRCIRMALRELAARGHRRIGLAMRRASDDRVDHAWLAGYLVDRHDVPRRQQIPPLMLPQWDASGFAAWLRKTRPDAIVTKLPQVLPALPSLGKAVPDDIGVACLSEALIGEGHSGVDENPRLVGAAAVDFVAGLLHRNERGVPSTPQRLMIDGVWIEGRTVRPRPTAAYEPAQHGPGPADGRLSFAGAVSSGGATTGADRTFRPPQRVTPDPRRPLQR